MRSTARTLVSVCLLASSSSLLAQPGQSGMAFLKLGVSGRGIGMADAMGAEVSGAAATHYNPAGLVAPAGTPGTSQLMFMHREWIQDSRTEFLGSSIVLDSENALGASVSSSTVSDIEVRTRPGPPEGTFTSRQFSTGLSYARAIGVDLRLGVTAKFLYQKIFVDEASGFAADVGGIWETPLEHLSLGAAVSNLGSMSALREEKITLPALLRIGPAYRLMGEGSQLSALAAADFVRIFPEKRNYVNTGGELTFNNLFAARVGYQFGSEGRGLSFGIGIQYGILVLDYAYAKLSSDLGDGHTISLGLNL